MSEAISTSVGDLSKLKYGSPDFELAVALRKNAGVYAAFKNHEERGKLVDLLTDDSGNSKSWNDFRKLAAPLTVLYDKTHLETEYNQAMANASMAKKWNGFAGNADMYPNLEYRAVMDGHVRAEHAALNGTILPINDPFWEANYPPNGWGCRCSVTQTDKDPVYSDEAKAYTPEPGFDFNPGIDQKLFSDGAGYYQTSNKSQIEDAAQTLLIRESRNIEKFADTVSAEGLGEVSISSKGWKEAINQPHPAYVEKNMALQNLQGLIDSATETKVIGSTKENPMVKQYHALKVEIGDQSSWVLLREAHDGKLSFYAIVEKLKTEK